VSETGFLPAKVPQSQNLQQAAAPSIPIKHRRSVVEQKDPRLRQQTGKMEDYCGNTVKKDEVQNLEI